LESREEKERIREPLGAERGAALGRVLAVAALLVVVVVVALAVFGGGDGYRVTAAFENAGQLVKGNQVRVGGGAVGSIEDISLADDGQALVEMKVDGDLTPLHEGTTATIRATSLSGIANRYVALNPGPNDAREIPDGGRIASERTQAPVDLDQLFDSLDGKTREGLRNFIRGQADWYDGRSKQAEQSTKYLAPFLSSTTELTTELALDQRVLERFLRDGAATVGAIAERRDDLAGLVRNTGVAAGAIGDENVALARALDLLPPTLRKANTTFVNLRSTLNDLDVLVDVSKPATKDLDVLFSRLRPLVSDARPTVADLRTLIRKPGASNDLIDLLSVQPRLASLTDAAFPRAIRTLDRAQPVIDYGRGYTPDLAGWLTKFGAVAANYDANGHYARVFPQFNPTTFDNGVLTANDPSQRLDQFQRPNLGRCPGGAMQPSPDGSAPRSFEGCNTSASPTTSVP
jgi:phospholipid/cholesterol/gamma-HCH transport system substrate-binding protein